jgi:hypothetical protein
VAEYPSLDGFAEEYGANGLYVVSNNSDPADPLPTLKLWYTSKGWPHVYDYYGNVDTSVWVPYGYSYGIPYNVLIDKDGHIRMAENFADGWEDIIQQCVGAGPYS